MDWRNSKSVKYFLNIQHIWATPPWFRLCVTQFRERRLAKIFSALYFVISIFNSKLLQTKCCDNNFCQMNTPITILQGTAHCGIPRVASKKWRVNWERRKSKLKPESLSKCNQCHPLVHQWTFVEPWNICGVRKLTLIHSSCPACTWGKCHGISKKLKWVMKFHEMRL